MPALYFKLKLSATWLVYLSDKLFMYLFLENCPQAILQKLRTASLAKADNFTIVKKVQIKWIGVVKVVYNFSKAKMKGSV